jgi:hypothetical protein
VAVYAHGNAILPQDLAKALIYPGALLHTVEGAVADGESIRWPSWDSLLNNFFNTSKSNSQIQAPVSLGFVVGCVLCLVGGMLSMFGPSVFSFVGMMMTLYYIYTRGGEIHNIKSMPMFALAVFCSFGWISCDLFTPRGVLWRQPSARGTTTISHLLLQTRLAFVDVHHLCWVLHVHPLDLQTPVCLYTNLICSLSVVSSILGNHLNVLLHSENVELGQNAKV